jgi:ABC-type glycerol-3-phosphate transport system substrate-binding protein
MKRLTRLLSCILLACLGISTFAGGKSDAPAAAVGAGEAAAYYAPVTGTVQFWTFLDPKDPGPRSVVQGQLVEAFEKKYNVKVDVIYKYWADIPGDFIRATAGGIAPDVLRISMPKSWKQMLSAETLASISDYAEFTDADKKDWVLPWDVYTDNGKKYAMPTSYQFVGLYTNPQHLAEVGAGIPKTWDELAETALKLSGKGYIGYVIKFLTSTEAQVLNARIAGELPSRLSAYNDPWFSSSDVGKEMLKWKELLREVGVMMDFYEDWLPMRQAFADAAQEIILQGAPIKETLKKHADAFNSQRR